jgi:hypothetical protein
MALTWPEGNRAGPLFPRLLLGLSAKMNLDGNAPENQLLSSDLIFLSNSSNDAPPTITSPLMKKVGVPSTLKQQISFPSEAG